LHYYETENKKRNVISSERAAFAKVGLDMTGQQEFNTASARNQQTESHVTHELESLATKHKFDKLSQQLHSMPWSERESIVQQLKIDREQKEKSIPGFPALTFTNDGELESVNHVAHTAKNGTKQLYDVQYNVQSGNRESESVNWQNPFNGATGHTDMQFNAAGKETSAYQTEMTTRGTSITSEFMYDPETGKIRSRQDAFRHVDGEWTNDSIQFANNGNVQAEQKSWLNSYGNYGSSNEQFDSETGKREFLWKNVAFADGEQEYISEQDDSKTGRQLSFYKTWLS
jgi:hypothetical protein